MEMCYNDCKLNRTESKPKTRCQICQIMVHNICLDEPKKTISSGAWTCRDCRKNPLNTKILLDLVTGLCNKIAILEPIILSLKKQSLLTSTSSQTDSLSDGTHMSTQTEVESPLTDITASSPNDIEFINSPLEQDLSMGTENTSATVSYIHEIYPLIEEFSDIDSDDDFITLTQLSVSDNDSGEDQTPIVSLSSGSTPLVSDSIVSPTAPVQYLEQTSSDDFSTISNLSLKINEAADALGNGLVDSSSNTFPLLHSTPATVPRIRENDRNSDKQNIREVTTTDMSVTQLSSLRHTCYTSRPTPAPRVSVNKVHTVLPPDDKVTYHDVYIGNVRGSTTEDDIKMQLMSMGVREFGNIVRLRSRNMSNSAFRVFIADQHIDKNVYNKACWHGNIKVEPYRARRNTRHQLNSRNRESKEIVKRQHSSNESTHHPSNKSWRSRYSRAPRFRSSSSEHSTSRYQPRTPLSSESRPEKLSVRSSCYSSSTNHPNPSDHCGINHVNLHGQQYMNAGSPENVNAFNPQHTFYPCYTNTSPHQPLPDMRHIIYGHQHGSRYQAPACGSVSANTAYTINRK